MNWELFKLPSGWTLISPKSCPSEHRAPGTFAAPPRSLHLYNRQVCRQMTLCLERRHPRKDELAPWCQTFNSRHTCLTFISKDVRWTVDIPALVKRTGSGRSMCPTTSASPVESVITSNILVNGLTGWVC